MLYWILHSPMGFTFLLVAGFILIILVYILPVLLAWGLGSPNLSWITIVNILLGWTVLGWVVALVLALRSGNGESFDE